MVHGWRPEELVLPTYSCVALLNVGDQMARSIQLRDCEYMPAEMWYPTYGCDIAVDLFGVGTNETPLIRDCAQSFGGAVCDAQMWCLSFHESKIISAQHGGAVVANNPDLLARLRDLNGYADAVVADRLNDSPTYVQRMNYRMSGLNAALALSQLDRLTDFVNRRGHIAAYYNDVLAGCPAILPTKVPAGSIYGRYVMALERMHPVDAITALEAHGIEAGRGCWPLLHRYLGQSPDGFPNAEKAGRTVLSLPCYPALRDSEVEVIAEATRSVLCTP